ncbi:MAG: hypothetical protein ACE5IH_08815 [Thermodesulfobacteriota bacterium]
MEWMKTTRKKRRRGNQGLTVVEGGLIWKPMRFQQGRQAVGTRMEKTIGEVVGEVLREARYKCAFCKGKGEKPLGSRCPVCKGRGEVSIMNPPAVRCAFCKGRGEAKPRSNVTCLACKGKGIIPVVEPIEVCCHCKGLGHNPGNNTLHCGRCRGKGVVTVKERHRNTEETKRFIRRPNGSEREAARVVYELGEASNVDIGARTRVSSSYAEYICKSMVEKGCLERVSRGRYILTPDCEKVMAEEEEKDLEKVTPDQREVLKAVERKGEIAVKEISEEMGVPLDSMRKICTTLGERDFVDIMKSGMVRLRHKGEKVVGEKRLVDWHAG